MYKLYPKAGFDTSKRNIFNIGMEKK
jgi:hypothetical protein